jgi:hypothetical protein
MQVFVSHVPLQIFTQRDNSVGSLRFLSSDIVTEQSSMCARTFESKRRRLYTLDRRETAPSHIGRPDQHDLMIM